MNQLINSIIGKNLGQMTTFNENLKEKHISQQAVTWSLNEL